MHADDVVFDGSIAMRIPCKSTNPDKAVAYVVAVQAAILSSDEMDETGDVLLFDVTAGGIMTNFFLLRCKANETSTAYADNQHDVSIQVLLMMNLIAFYGNFQKYI